MRPAFPASDYYEPSAPSQRHQPTASLPTQGGRRWDGSHVHHVSIDWVGAQLFPLQHRYEYAAVLPRGLSTDRITRLRSPRPRPRTACAAFRPTSTRLEPASALRGFNRWFTLVTPFRLAERAQAVWWYRPASPSSGLLPPSPALPGSGCPQLSPGCCDSPTPEPFHLRSIGGASWRTMPW
jgi:hypothetical protein